LCDREFTTVGEFPAGCSVWLDKELNNSLTLWTEWGLYGKDMEMKEQIGAAAGKIWHALEKNDQVSISQLPKLLKERDVVVYQALGWLAREDKIAYETRGNATYVSINHH
jgi:hypothetical protein